MRGRGGIRETILEKNDPVLTYFYTILLDVTVTFFSFAPLDIGVAGAIEKFDMILSGREIQY